MEQITDSQELARRFNEDEAVWQRYEYRRRLRLRLRLESLLPDELLDELDWIEAESECRQVWCVGEDVSIRHRPHAEGPTSFGKLERGQMEILEE